MEVNASLVLPRQPKNATSHVHQAKAYIEQNDMAKAIEHLSLAVLCDVGSADPTAVVVLTGILDSWIRTTFRTQPTVTVREVCMCFWLMDDILAKQPTRRLHIWYKRAHILVQRRDDTDTHMRIAVCALVLYVFTIGHELG
jgi:hypothetical protein